MMKRVIAIVLVTTLSACGNLVKNGGIVEAQNAINEANYQEALEYTDIAESFGDLTPESRARLHYLRAQAQEGLGLREDALDNYRYVVNQHGGSAYAEPSQRKINALSGD